MRWRVVVASLSVALSVAVGTTFWWVYWRDFSWFDFWLTVVFGIVPVAMTAVPLFFIRHPGRFRHASRALGISLAVFTILTLFGTAAFYLPSALLMICASLGRSSNRSVPSSG
jgi:hypothetical protein